VRAERRARRTADGGRRAGVWVQGVPDGRGGRAAGLGAGSVRCGAGVGGGVRGGCASSEDVRLAAGGRGGVRAVGEADG
jgi:hypothetical protein